MLIYYGGCERPNAIHTLARAGGRRVMISFAEQPTETCWQLYREYGIALRYLAYFQEEDFTPLGWLMSNTCESTRLSRRTVCGGYTSSGTSSVDLHKAEEKTSKQPG